MEQQQRLQPRQPRYHAAVSNAILTLMRVGYLKLCEDRPDRIQEADVKEATFEGSEAKSICQRRDSLVPIPHLNDSGGRTQRSERLG